VLKWLNGMKWATFSARVACYHRSTLRSEWSIILELLQNVTPNAEFLLCFSTLYSSALSHMTS